MEVTKKLRWKKLLVAGCIVLAACSPQEQGVRRSDQQDGTPPGHVEEYRADFAGHDMSGASLRGAILRRVDFADARLLEADLRGATLIAGSFRGADLRGADFAGADLRLADFTGADVRGANFLGVVWGETTCVDGENSSVYLGVCPMLFYGATQDGLRP